MRVSFTKDHHRYGVYVHRDEAPDLWIYGPGYDDDLPHDLLHFVAEAEYGLDGGVFGDVAAGGNAKIFVPVDPTLVAKVWRQKRIEKCVLPDGSRSEVLAGELHRGWRDRSLPAPLLAKLDALAAQWRGLAIGESLTLEWPRPEGRKRHPPRQPKRSRHSRRPVRQ
ncbi:MAG: hypothetical protein ABUS54_04610 [Actinomycetota bacterium]